MKADLSARQICFMLIAYSAAGKLLMLPAQLAYFSGNDLWISAVISYILQIAAVWAVAFLCSKTDKTFFELAEISLGKVVSRILMCLFALFFAVAAFLPMYEQKLFVHEIFYDTIPALTVFIPFFFLSVYMGGKGLNNAGRVADILLPLFLAAFAAIFVMSVSEANFGWLMPVFSHPVKSILRGVYSTLYNFADGAVMLMFMGRFKYKKGDCTKITLSYSLGAALVILFMLVFYSVYSTLSQDEYFSVGQSAIFFPALSVMGRADLLAVYVIETAMLSGVILYIQLCTDCLSRATDGRIKPVGWSFIVNGVLLALLIIFNDKYKGLQTVYGNILWYVYAVFALLLPIAAWLLKRKGEQDEK